MTLLDVLSVIERTNIEKHVNIYAVFNNKVDNDPEEYKQIKVDIYNVLLHKDAKVVGLCADGYANEDPKLTITIQL